MPSLGPTELIIILVLALVLFGAGKLGDVGSALGKSIREFRHAAEAICQAAKVAEAGGAIGELAVLPQTAPAAPRQR